MWISLLPSSFFEFFLVSWFLRTFFLLFELLILFPFSVGTWNRLFHVAGCLITTSFLHARFIITTVLAYFIQLFILYQGEIKSNF